mmetsp:Transcript_48242/g.105326  ORF Transcript_48242/g.105326 Transcript_48242/m.105326 type:complete len:1259 (-) Transcript_48242:60-3836(-)
MSLEARGSAAAGGEDSSLVLRLPPSDEDYDRERGPLEGKFVQLLEGAEGAEGGLYSSSCLGWATSWDSDASRYVVETMNGGISEVAADKVQEFEPAPCEEGGFDMAWPPMSYEDSGLHAALIADCLQRKNYCYMQVAAEAEARESFFALAQELGGAFTLPKQELRESYLGRNAKSKVNWLEAQHTENSGVLHYNEYMKMLHLMLMQSGEEFLGLNFSESRMGTMLRACIASDSELRRVDTGELDRSDVEDGKVEEFIDFMQRRRLCIMYLVTGNGGTIELYPKDSEEASVKLTIEKDRLLIFRHDLMSYSYQPADSEDLVLQSWMVEPAKQALDLQVSGDYMKTMEELEMQGPEERLGLSKYWTMPSGGVMTWITSFHCRCGGNILGDSWVPSMAAGSSGVIEVPSNRWDIDLYYSGPDLEMGKTFTKHTACVTDAEWAAWDHVFFEYTYEEAAQASIYDRHCLETPYMNTVKAGLTRKELRHQVVSHYLGLSGSLDTQNGKSPCLTLPYYLNLRGRASIIDTACSSSLVAVSMAHTEIATGRSNMNICTGAAAMMDVFSYISMSSGRMLGNRGRSYTFDHSADGYGRGEGALSVLIESSGTYNPIRSGCKQKEPWEMIRFIGSNMNQDGKSASITAPSGPAQTACMKAAVRESCILPPEIDFSECHGTGTALGDPIEVGSSRILNDPYVRETPWVLGATKTQLGHLELGAGVVGILRCLIALPHCSAPPNVHLYQLNEHFSLEGYPTAMPCEAGPLPYRCNLGGVNSFGFGGTNCRIEFWAKKTEGGIMGDMDPAVKTVPKEAKLDKLNYMTRTCPDCLGPMCWTCAIYIPLFHTRTHVHRCSDVRELNDQYDLCSRCYTGSYLHGGTENEFLDDDEPPETVYLVGTWGKWTEYEMMRKNKDGHFECAIRLGETRMEKFRIAMDSSLDVTVHPILDNASGCIAIEGPDRGGDGKSWLIDGHVEGSPEGTVYRIVLEWGISSYTTGVRVETGPKKVRWFPVEDSMPNLKVHRNFNKRHKYAMCCSYKAFEPDDMHQGFDDPPTLWRTQVKIPHGGALSFFFARDADVKDQAIYPAQEGVQSSELSIPAMGPDNARNGRSFRFDGKVGEVVIVTMDIADAKVKVVATNSVTGTEMSWESVPRQYGIMGSWIHNEAVAMEADDDAPAIYRASFRLGAYGSERFSILADMDWNKVLYPQNDGDLPGDSGVYGPGAVDEDKHNFWEVYGDPGTTVEVKLDMAAKHRHHMVTCDYFDAKSLES